MSQGPLWGKFTTPTYICSAVQYIYCTITTLQMSLDVQASSLSTDQPWPHSSSSYLAHVHCVLSPHRPWRHSEHVSKLILVRPALFGAPSTRSQLSTFLGQGWVLGAQHWACPSMSTRLVAGILHDNSDRSWGLTDSFTTCAATDTQICMSVL